MTARRSSDSPSPPPSIDAPSLPLNHPLVALGSPSLPAFIPESLDEMPINTDRPTELLTDPPTDPPPPYPSPRTRRRARGTRRRVSDNAQSVTLSQQQQQQQQQQQHSQIPSTESDTETQTPRSPRTSLPQSSSVYDGADVSETTPLLGGGGGGGGGANNSPNANAVRTFLRPRSLSQSSMNSFAPSLASLAQTAWVFFSECESDEEEEGESRFENGHTSLASHNGHNDNGQPSFEGEGEFETEDAGPSRTIINSTRRRAARYPHPATFIRASASEFGIDLENQNQNHNPRPSAARQRPGLFSAQAWARYFRPVTKAIYWRSLTHLVAVNFPFALAAWVYLFVFTVTGTTLLILLPLGAILCFFNLLGARAFSRAELFLQTKFHSPLHYPLTVLHAAAAAASSSSSSYPSTSTSTSSPASSVHQLIAAYPIFTRTRPPSASELESGEAVVGEEVREGSFYRNTYAMFTDSTSFQALFYFLVIKPAITLLFTVFFLVVCVPLMVLVVPAPAVLRVCRRIGRWQAVVAVEGLAVGVR
ncbi:hypothetical protein F5878DRAFT_591933 [Lentinula raphanica]|uniref:Uncharacterized protein n=1 Tax=Lentinula raphanica TaxID=153919 RepID=A0AA38NWK7_9AGAR|nr:hypothetical protein F5878DRAFT_591933 [Lentinula raphanica]